MALQPVHSLRVHSLPGVSHPICSVGGHSCIRSLTDGLPHPTHRVASSASLRSHGRASLNFRPGTSLSRVTSAPTRKRALTAAASVGQNEPTSQREGGASLASFASDGSFPPPDGPSRAPTGHDRTEPVDVLKSRLGQSLSLLFANPSHSIREACDQLGRFAASIAITATVLSSAMPAYAGAVLAPPRKLMADELATVKLFNDNTASVVYITNLATRKDAFTLDVMQVPQGTGSGFIWDTEGHVVTNFHVIRRASDLRVTLSDQSVYAATVVGADPNKDVAVLRIDAPAAKLRPLPVGCSSDLLVGQKVFAIGNPFGLDHTLTTGVISGLQREITSVTRRPIQDVIQTDAAINPGNSGGPLLDSSGTLIGINTAIYSPSGASSGVGFAIPVDTVSGIVDQIISYGQVTRPALNLAFAPEQLVEQLGISGVLVLEVNPSGAAAKAGLRPTSRDSFGRLLLGDIITAIDGKPVQSGSDLYKILDKCKVGQTVDVRVLRGDDEVSVLVTLDGLSG